MVKVLKTNSNYYVAFADNIDLSADEIRSYKAMTYNDDKIQNCFNFSDAFPKADTNLTRNLMTEIRNYIPPTGQAINELADNTKFKQEIQDTAKRTNLSPYYADYTIEAKDLPSDFSTGVVSIRREEEFYFTKYDSKSKRYICCNENGIEKHINSNRAAFNFKKNEVIIHDKVFFFSPEDKATILKINQLKVRPDAKEALKQLPQQQLALYNFYLDITRHYLDKKQKLFSVNHELKHALTQQKINQRRSKPNYAELSPTNIYRFSEDDEKSAHLKETYLGIANYFQSGGNLNAFPKKSQWLIDKLTPLSPEKRQEVLTNHNYIVNGNIDNWNKFYANTYTKSSGEEEAQLISLAASQAWDVPVFRIDESDSEYIERRSIAYTLDIYNPQTKKYEKKDLSHYIKIPTTIRDYNRQEIDKLEAICKQRRRNIEAKGITQDLVLSLFNETYQEPFKINNTEVYKEQILKQGVSFKSKNRQGEPIDIKAQKQSSTGRPNCISLTTYRDNQPIFNFILDEDRKEYNCFNYRTKQKYSNLKDSKHASLPEEVQNQIKAYLKELSSEVNKQILRKTNSNSGNNQGK